MSNTRVVTLSLAFAWAVAGACRSRCEPAVATGVELGAEHRAPELRLDAQGEPLGLEHFRKWSEHLTQGGEPVGAQAFENLAALGIRTVLSVDGAAPAVDEAAKWGLRYVHVPIGYDGIDARQALEICKAVQVSTGPVYIHCHHGLHRGPAAAALARIGLEGVDSAEALAGLSASGCKYAGLFRDVGAFAPPSTAELARVPAELPSVRAPRGLVQSMSFIDRRWDPIQASSKAGWAALAEHPDIDIAHEVGMLENALRSLLDDEQRQPAHDARFVGFLRDARSAASELEAALRAGATERADPSFARLKQSCDACHAAYRNP